MHNNTHRLGGTMTKAQEIQDAQDTLATITRFIRDIGGNITPEIQRGLVSQANWCHVALGHPRPFMKAKTQIDTLIINARSAKNNTK